ncbi:hypothetical protein CH063_02562 [Colletotrichum higginsianum]|uniref:Uncharacterized protein n=1 Tax=Colletotrichum higginsianum (strain IMI 349063) TaxID=759273 RepID=H1VM48_COLHI|nr:hypothetical protein CH063_02562 [Colletotrichum higginsianum]
MDGSWSLSLSETGPQDGQVFSNISQRVAPPTFVSLSNFPRQLITSNTDTIPSSCQVEACCPTTATARARIHSRSCNRRISSSPSCDRIRLQSSGGGEPVTAPMLVHALTAGEPSSAPNTWSAMCERVSHPNMHVLVSLSVSVCLFVCNVCLVSNCWGERELGSDVSLAAACHTVS